MKFKFMCLIFSSVLLAACGSESDSQVPTKSAATPSSKSTKGHFFKVPYSCQRSDEVVSKSTGKKRTRIYTSYYHPQRGWRLDITPATANLYTIDTRYDGVPAKSSGSKIFGRRVGLTPEEIKQAKFVLATAFPYTKPLPDAHKSNLSKYKKKNCEVLADSSIFDIDYLDKTEVMGQ